MVKKSIQAGEIRTLLSENDVRISDIAAANEVTPTHVSRVIKRETTSKRVAESICLAMGGLPLSDVFGDVETYFSPKKRGPRSRAERTAEITQAIRKGVPVPPPQNQEYAQTAAG
ncbi:hypothetical protein MHM93_15405 [Pseudoalteromonas sp. MM17-2]|uniref:hypothetical protein n=1 Tax=Pseudoalteromonas sp. MM17-2 TaxID=2917753 RepID=UPI001EF54706|nr:hypothetical protein [Pseudoalteromonas sp. MM17-2]MCG7545568.1 hypothetical protein [Pseudoalteromonas sp. MM17-2]